MRRILYCFLFIAGGGIIHASAREERVGTEDRIKPDSVLFVDSFDGSSVVPDTAVWKLCTYANNAWSQWFRDVRITGLIKMAGYSPKSVFPVVHVWKLKPD